MSLTNRILLAMVLGIGLGSVLEVVLGSLSPDSGLYGFLYNGMVMGLFDVLGRIFIASLKLLVVPLVLVSLISVWQPSAPAAAWDPSQERPWGFTSSRPVSL